MNKNKPRAMFIDMAYTLEWIRKTNQLNFFQTRHSEGFFEHVWGVHPLADRAGSRATGIVEERFSDRQVIIEGVSTEKKGSKVLAPFRFIRAQRKLLRRLEEVIRQNKIDLIFASDPFYSGLVATRLAKRTGAALVVAVYQNAELNWRTHRALAMPKLLPSYRLQTAIARAVLRKADLVVGGTEEYLRWGRKHGAKSRGAVISIARHLSPVHMVRPEERPSPDQVFARLGIPTPKQHVVMASRLIPLKFATDGVQAAIQAFSQHSDGVAMICGEGPLKARLEAMVAAAGLSDRIHFLGHVNQETLSTLFPNSITLSPLTGMALVEAGLGGSPAIAYDADWQSEFVKDGVNGFLVPLGDHQAMGERLLQLLRDEGLRGRMSEAMRQNAMKVADRATIAEKEHEVFGALLEAKAKQRA